MTIAADQQTKIGPWGVQAEISYRLSSDQFQDWFSFRRFLFRWKGAYENRNGWRVCWWPHGEITILGLTIGAGVYIDRGKADAYTSVLTR